MILLGCRRPPAVVAKKMKSLTLVICCRCSHSSRRAASLAAPPSSHPHPPVPCGSRRRALTRRAVASSAAASMLSPPSPRPSHPSAFSCLFAPPAPVVMERAKIRPMITQAIDVRNRSPDTPVSGEHEISAGAPCPPLPPWQRAFRSLCTPRASAAAPPCPPCLKACKRAPAPPTVRGIGSSRR